MQRRNTRAVAVGSVTIGSGYPIAVQSMLCAAPKDFDANIAQARALKEAGCDIIRLAIPTMEDIWRLPLPKWGSIKFALTPAILVGKTALTQW